MSDIKIDTTEIMAAAQRYGAAKPVVAAEMRIAMERSVKAVERRAKEIVPKDTQHLMRSITGQVVPNSGGMLGKVGTNVPYAEVVEKGRGAGKPMPPAGALRGWMGRHGFPVSAEFALRRKIGVAGIAPRPFLTKALHELDATIRREFAQVPKRIVARMAKH